MDLTLDCFKIQNFTSNDYISTKSGIFIVLEGDYKIMSKSTNSAWVIDSKSPKNRVLDGRIESEDEEEFEIRFLDQGKIAITTA